MVNAIVFLADGFEEVEALTPVDYLRRAGVFVTTVAVPSSTMNQMDLVTGGHSIKVQTDVDFNGFKKSFGDNLPDLVYVPGGLNGSKNCAACKDLMDYLVKCFEAGKYVASICAAPALVLSKTGILKGKNWTCYPGMESEVEPEDVEDSTHVETEPFIVDGNVLTSRGAGTVEQFSIQMIKLLCGEETAEQIRKSTVQR